MSARRLQKFRKVYQDAAILRHKMQNRLHKRRSRRRKQAQQEYALEEADRMSQLVQHHNMVIDAAKQGSDVGSILNERSSIRGGPDDINMFQDLTELSMSKEFRDKKRQRTVN